MFQTARFFSFSKRLFVNSAMKKSQQERPDRAIITLFAAFLREIGQPVRGVDCWPEDHAEGEIDAIVGPYALQHTSVDSLPEGRAHDARFSEVIKGIEAAFRGKLGFFLAITFSWGSIEKGHNYKSINRALRDWISNQAAKLSLGHHRVENPEIPFPLGVIKGVAINYDGPLFGRYDPHDKTLSARLRAQIFGERHDKLTPLLPYRERGKKTLLLLESGDIALMSVGHMVEAFEIAFPSWPDSLDELWFLHRASSTHFNIHDLCAGHMWLFEVGDQKVVGHSTQSPNVGLWRPTAARP
jgi:hypothetical protein